MSKAACRHFAAAASECSTPQQPADHCLRHPLPGSTLLPLPVPSPSRLYPSVEQGGTRTGRLAMTGANLMALPNVSAAGALALCMLTTRVQACVRIWQCPCCMPTSSLPPCCGAQLCRGLHGRPGPGPSCMLAKMAHHRTICMVLTRPMHTIVGYSHPLRTRCAPHQATRDSHPLVRDFRRCLTAAPGCVLLAADYSQIELRLLAHITGVGAREACARA